MSYNCISSFPQQTLFSSWKQLHRLSLSTGEIIGFLYRKVLPRYQIKQLFCRRYHLFVRVFIKGFYQFRVQSRSASCFLLSSLHPDSISVSIMLFAPTFSSASSRRICPRLSCFYCNCGFLGHLIQLKLSFT